MEKETQMKTWKLVTGAALLFILGCLTGLLLAHYFRGYGPPPWEHGPKSRSAAILARLSKDLALTEDQKVRVGKIIEETETKVDAQLGAIEPGMRALVNESFDRISKELDEKQQKRLRAFRERMEKRMERARGR
jgi:Spy/CpxP family protein refolding chaperone